MRFRLPIAVHISLALTAVGLTPVEAATALAPETNSVGAKRVVYRSNAVIPLSTKVRFTSIIVLPEDEQILDWVVGDKDFWIIDGAENLAFVKPAKVGSRTNLHLVTASGNIYSFVLTELAEQPDGLPDLKVFVRPAESSMRSGPQGRPRFVPVKTVDRLKEEIARAEAEAQQVRAKTDAEIDRKLAQARQSVRFPYRFDRDEGPFFVSSMWHDDRFTFIRANPQELPALYEEKDGKPNLINFDYRDGLYVVPKVLDSGYLAIGKRKLRFRRKGRYQPPSEDSGSQRRPIDSPK